ncbi:MAG: lipocalin family protein [Defluviitaleaceae bacterium]|nr:lipocalin family protein [Defluviitaleaceae bacterium]
MKKLILAGFIAIILLASLTPAANATEWRNDPQFSLEQHLIGTWRWVSPGNYTIVFREDGVMISGMPGLRIPGNWMVVDNRLIVDGEDLNIRIVDDSIILDRLGSTFIYEWYSDSTEGEASLRTFMIIGIVAIVFVLAFVVGIIVLIVVLVIRRGKKREGSHFDNITPPGQG